MTTESRTQFIESMNQFLGTLSDKEATALANPLLLDEAGRVVNDIQQGKALLDPTLALRPDLKKEQLPIDGKRPHQLSLDQHEKAALFTQVLIKLVKHLTGHGNLSLSTFDELTLMSTGMFGWYERSLLLVYKSQSQIGRGDLAYKLGKPGRFIFAQQRKTLLASTLEIVASQFGYVPPEQCFNKWGADHQICDPDYSMAHRLHNWGIVFAYAVQFTEQMMGELAAHEKVTLLKPSDPHPSNDELEAYKGTGMKFVRAVSEGQSHEFEQEGMLSLEKELPVLQEIWHDPFYFNDLAIRADRVPT